MIDFKKTVSEVVDALRAVVDAMAHFDAARMGFSQGKEAAESEGIYAAVGRLRRLLQAPIHDAGRPDGRRVSLEFVDWPPELTAMREAVLSLNEIPPLSWETEVFSPNIPGATERLLACSLSRFAGVLATLEGMPKRTADTKAVVVIPQSATTTIDDSQAMRTLAALAGSETLQLQSIAQDQTLSADDKLRRMASIDCRIYGKNGEELGEVCGVTAAAIRKTDWWKVNRKAVLKKDRDDSGEL